MGTVLRLLALSTSSLVLMASFDLRKRECLGRCMMSIRHPLLCFTRMLVSHSQVDAQARGNPQFCSSSLQRPGSCMGSHQALCSLQRLSNRKDAQGFCRVASPKWGTSFSFRFWLRHICTLQGACRCSASLSFLPWWHKDSIKLSKNSYDALGRRALGA